ncbi:hypothetical protein [Ideonella azotifigens]|nr:hypothetical protein [Ideonella azotifigens]
MQGQGATPPDGPKPSDTSLQDTAGRFFMHWVCASFGFFLRTLLPVVQKWQDPSAPVEFPRWWAFSIFALLICLLAGAINSNMPVKPRELLKSIGLGFALDAAAVLSKIPIH